MAARKGYGATNVAPIPFDRTGLDDFPPADPPGSVIPIASIRVDPEAMQKGIEGVKAELATLISVKQSGGILNQPTADIIKESLQDWSRQWDSLEGLRTDTTKPLNEAKRRVDALFKPGLDQLKGLITFGKELLGTWEVVLANRQREALALATDAVEAGDVQVLTGALNIANAPKTPSNGVSAKARWVARVTDALALPMRFQKTIADEAAISAYVGKFEPHQVPDPVKGLAFELVGGVTRVSR